MQRLVLFALVFGFCLCDSAPEDLDNGNNSPSDPDVKDTPKFKCDYSYNKDTGGYIRFRNMPLTFFGAKAVCEREGAILASPINEGIKSAMMKIMNTSKVDSAFTGIRAKRNNKAVFTSIEGIRLEDMPVTWAEGQPDNFAREEYCIDIAMDGRLSDTGCIDTPLPYFCVMKTGAARRLKPCGRDYYLDENTGKCYKYHYTESNWEDALTTCEFEEGNLAIIKSNAEAEAVAKLFSDKSSNVQAFIGFRYDKEAGLWLTLKDETLTEAGYDKWDAGEPNTDSANHICGGISGLGKLHDLRCYGKRSFICEKDPKITVC